ncbi:NAD(P)/FAD-dependent oxidoreductase [Streptomyces mexicanus]|jgi:3-phenylpropionate/trans-cinnamate dioxygenase ferredoxin reductase subunit|uniref:FAD-dependent oxidoreductase n=1 Tax=Streptomyces mexicanus TaxID=178566 RepID=A0A7X1HXH0_9ACTN|nr:FAD-dependent oxidoreductase [Streptomyces mexicanus]MBC2864994.1 FAD-dependent oxidoreductase [Streptomyces mexicanus]
MRTEEIVVVGAGQAGGEAVAALRMAGFEGGVTLVGDEPHLPYSRPPLSKDFLLGDVGTEVLLLRPPHFYEKHRVRTLLGRTVTKLDRDRRTITLDDGGSLTYGTLILATGGHARRLRDPMAEAAPNVHYVRTIADIERLRPELVPGARLAVIGGGYVGLEIAAVGRKLGLEVTVVEAAPRLLARVAGPDISAFVHRVHTEEGVDIRLGTTVTGFVPGDNGRVTAAVLADGTTVGADVVVVGIGLVPRDQLAADAGLDVADGIVVDEFCRTGDEAIYAIGDCTRHPCAEHGGMRRLESVQNASEQARVAAAAITDDPRAYAAVPWFWSDQYDLKLRSVGIAADYDQTVVRGSLDEGRSAAVFYLKAGRVRAAEVVSSPRDFGAAKKLVAHRAEVAPERLADLGTPLKDLLTSR